MPPDLPSEYRNVTVRLSSLTFTDHIIRGVRFTECTLVGPGIIVPMGRTEIVNCTWEGGSFDELIWPIADQRQAIIGAIGLEDCLLSACRLRLLGLGVPEQQIEKVRAEFDA